MNSLGARSRSLATPGSIPHIGTCLILLSVVVILLEYRRKTNTHSLKILGIHDCKIANAVYPLTRSLEYISFGTNFLSYGTKTT